MQSFDHAISVRMLMPLPVLGVRETCRWVRKSQDSFPPAPSTGAHACLCAGVRPHDSIREVRFTAGPYMSASPRSDALARYHRASGTTTLPHGLR